MRLGVLTSSRADFGIYLPLLERVQKDSFFDLEIIAFGTHLSKYHGYTLAWIYEYGFEQVKTVSSLLTNDDENAIATAYGLTCLKFADFWSANKYDLVLCLGDRYEMSAAVQAGIPFNLKFAHFHGGETTLGAIDNIYRHQITLASKLHFTAAEPFSKRIGQILGTEEGVHCVGSLSLDGIKAMPIIPENEFRNKYNIHGDFLLITFHPETVSKNRNHLYAEEMIKALAHLTDQSNLVITMPNADTMGSIFREALIKLQKNHSERVQLIENFGKENYFAAMRYCKCLLGNTSSGIIEAASFGKFVVNVGDRQKGRAQSANTINCSFNAQDIAHAMNLALEKGDYNGTNIYYRDHAVEQVIDILKTYPYEKL
uniref:UDP-N-acetyl-D-glucosamine 2-epimerase, UDP-hydrolysing n=1 Tax=Sphingobacterium sp. (strain 21) TaxID=743722 RepID=F4C951_SPHS2